MNLKESGTTMKLWKKTSAGSFAAKNSRSPASLRHTSQKRNRHQFSPENLIYRRRHWCVRLPLAEAEYIDGSRKKCRW